MTLRGFRELKRLVDEKCRSGGNGYEKVCLAFEAYREMYSTSPGMLKLINRGDAIKAGAAADLPYRLEATACERELFDALLKLYVEGQEDGSIRRDRDAAMLAFSAVFMTTGFFRLLAQSGGSFVRHFGLDMDAFVFCALEALTERLRKR